MRRLRTVAAVGAVALTVTLTLAGCVARESASDAPSQSDFTPSTTTETETESAEPSAEAGASTEGSCQFRTDQSGQEPAVGLPPDDGSGAASLTLTTSAGPITIQLDATRAPCTVHSMAFLAREGFFDNTTCHRMTTSESLKVLQCGDPEGTGGGGPGYVVPDELPTDLPVGPPGSDGQPTAIYGRGLVAMANGGANTTGSQFFLVYGDSTLPPNYTVIGTTDDAGLAVLDQIAAAGLTPNSSAQDGSPTTPVVIQTAVAA